MSSAEAPESERPVAAKRAGDARVRALPVVAVCIIFVTIAGVLWLGRLDHRAPPPTVPTGRRGDEPVPVRDEDHYVPGSPPAVCERFLRAWMRARYDEARDLSTGDMRARAEHELAEIGSFTTSQMEELRHTRAYVDATHYDLEHVEIHDLPPGPDGAPRKQVLGQAHAYGAYGTTRMDSRRGQTFTVALVNGAWRIEARTWETFER